MTDARRNAAPALEISGDLDRYAAEVLRLEIRRLARRHQIEVREIRIEPAPEESEGSS
jgi:hypothetical protein